jgi:hypothetical protein
MIGLASGGAVLARGLVRSPYLGYLPLGRSSLLKRQPAALDFPTSSLTDTME